MGKSIEVDVHRGKLITFSIEIEGLDYTLISGKFRITIGEIEYGFPTTYRDGEIEAYIPSLHEILHDFKRDGKQISAKLEVVADHHYFVPWEGKLKITEPASVKVKLKKAKPKIKTEIKDQEVDEQQEIIIDDPEHTVDIPKSKTKPKKGESVDESTKSAYLKKLKGIGEKGIRAYMKRAGTKSENVQNVLLEQAETICKDPDNKFELLKSVVKVMADIKKGDTE